MGDMADYYLDLEDFYFFGEDCQDREDMDTLPAIRECRYCGKGMLHWTLTDNGWRLADDKNNVHSCKKYKIRHQNTL